MSKPDNSEIPLANLQYDDLKTFDYTKEDLDLEVHFFICLYWTRFPNAFYSYLYQIRLLENSKIFLAFKKSSFENEFISTLLRKTYPFATKYVILLLMTVPFYIVIDVCTTYPALLLEGVFALHALKFALMFFYFWFVHYLNEWRHAAIVGGLAISLFGITTVAIG